MKNVAYLFQASLISLWWIGILQYDTFYAYFEFNGIPKPLFTCFLVPDFIVISLLSLVLFYKETPSLQYMVLGAFLYAAIFCLSVSLTMGGGEISTVLMCIGAAFNFLLCRKTGVFRTALTNSTFTNLLKTFVQIVFVWSVFLFVVPFFLLRIESKIPVPFHWDGAQLLATMLFAIFSGLGLWTGYVLSAVGKGTPLPVDATQKLVVKGPYAYVRNPMAICGLGQALAIALFTQSVSIVLYALLGFFVWNFFVRKLEEEEMAQKFGSAFLDYRKAVRCWIPNSKPYRA